MQMSFHPTIERFVHIVVTNLNRHYFLPISTSFHNNSEFGKFLLNRWLCEILKMFNWAFDFAFLVAEFRTTTPESVDSSSNVFCRGL